MNKLYYDFHIHSCLSPCGDNDMTPQNVAAMCSLKELDAVALTDHNSCKNCPAFEKAFSHYDIQFIPGMELTTSEEVHVLCYFPSVEHALSFDQLVCSHLVSMPNREEIFGNQFVCNEDDEIIGKEDNLLITSTDISLDDVYDILRPYEGVMVPAHVDKTSTSIFSNLGFIPPDSKFHTVELLHPKDLDNYLPANPHLQNCRILCSSDAHNLGSISEPIHYLDLGKDASVKEILEYMKNENPFVSSE